MFQIVLLINLNIQLEFPKTRFSFQFRDLFTNIFHTSMARIFEICLSMLLKGLNGIPRVVCIKSLKQTKLVQFPKKRKSSHMVSPNPRIKQLKISCDERKRKALRPVHVGALADEHTRTGKSSAD